MTRDDALVLTASSARDLRIDPDVPVLPIWLLLAGLKENTQRAVIVG